MTQIPTPNVTYDVRPWRLGEHPWLNESESLPPAARVIIDNDFAGDPDDLYQLVHHLLSPGIEIPLVVASHLRPDDHFDSSGHSAANAMLIARDVFARMGLQSTDIIVPGSEKQLPDTQTPIRNDAVSAIIREAMREDTNLPLFYAAGGGLTDLASALLIEPEIAKRMTLVWIGGNEHDGLAFPPPDSMPVEYNLLIDITAGQVVFAAEELEIWQVPRDAYRQCLVSRAELRTRLKEHSSLGVFLYEALMTEYRRIATFKGGVTETYALGDSPLVLLTALRSTFEPEPTSSFYIQKPTPELTSTGTYRQRVSRPMRVYTHIDTRLMFEDMYAKINEFVRWSETK